MSLFLPLQRTRIAGPHFSGGPKGWVYFSTDEQTVFFLSFFKKKLVNWLRHIQVKISKDLVGPSLLIPNCYDKHKILREAPVCSKSQFLVKSMKLDNAGE